MRSLTKNNLHLWLGSWDIEAKPYRLIKLLSTFGQTSPMSSQSFWTSRMATPLSLRASTWTDKSWTKIQALAGYIQRFTRQKYHPPSSETDGSHTKEDLST